MECELLLDSLLEGEAFFECQGVGLGDDGYDIDDVGKLLQDDDIYGFEAVHGQYVWFNPQDMYSLRVARWLDEEETAVHTCVLDVSFSLCCEFFS